MGVDLAHGSVEDDAQHGVAEQVAEAVAQARAHQIFHNVALQHGPAHQVGQVVVLRAEAVVQVGVDDGADVPEPAHEQQGLHHVLGALALHLNARVLKGVVLGHVADGGHACFQRKAGVLQRVQRADHVVAEVGLHRHHLAHGLPLFGGVEDQARAHGDLAAQLGGHAHGPVQRNAEPVHRGTALFQRLINVAEALGCALPGVPADVRVLHHAALRRHFLLVLAFGFDAVLFHEQRLANGHLPGDFVHFGLQGFHVRQFLFLEPAFDVDVRHGIPSFQGNFFRLFFITVRATSSSRWRRRPAAYNT